MFTFNFYFVCESDNDGCTNEKHVFSPILIFNLYIKNPYLLLTNLGIKNSVINYQVFLLHLLIIFYIYQVMHSQTS